MITREQISNVLDHPVYDVEGKKIGEAKHVFLDDATGRPEWVAIRTGMFGKTESFAPILGADLVDDHLQIRYSKDKVTHAPRVELERGNHLSPTEEHRLFDHYGMDWDGAWRQANQPGAEGWAAGGGTAGSGTGTAAGAGTAAAGAGTAAAAGTAAGAAGGGMAGRHRRAETAEVASPSTTAERDLPRKDTAAALSGTGPAGSAGARSDDLGRTGTGASPTGARTGQDRMRDAAMMRSEEQLRIRVERRETGKARLHKYVTTERVQQTVPLRHQEVRIEREPIAEGDRRAALSAMSGHELGEAEYEVALHRETAVVDTELVPMERIRLVTEEKQTRETVERELRKEHIEFETPEHGRRMLG